MDINELKNKKVSAISLGCDKNRVDLEKMLYNIKEFGFNVSPLVEEAQIVIVNTCAFIQPAVVEAIETVLEAVHKKELGVEKVIVTGCLFSRYGEEIKNSLPMVDAYVDLKDNDKIVNIIAKLYDIDLNVEYKDGRLLTSQPHFAFLKIADGCDNGCAYCTIPRIRGRYKSVPMESLIKEAKTLAKGGVKELILVAQDTTRYGIDLYGEYRLVELIRELSKIKELHWIRLHYLYVEMVTDELLDEIYNNPKVCKYIDVPFQHIDDNILKSMNRRSSEQDIRNFIEKIHTKYPEISVRSTFIIGLPGEGRKEFKKLLEFLKEARLDLVGFFPFCREEKTKAFYMKKQVSGFVKKRRLKKAQDVQEQIMTANSINKIGDNVEIIVDFFDDVEQYYVGRASNQSPDVDLFVLLDASSNVKPGEFYNVRITDYMFGFFKGEVI